MELDEIVKFLNEWAAVPILDDMELAVIDHLLRAAEAGYPAFDDAVAFLGNNFTVIVLTAINKGRHYGVGKHAT